MILMETGTFLFRMLFFSLAESSLTCCFGSCDKKNHAMIGALLTVDMERIHFETLISISSHLAKLLKWKGSFIFILSDCEKLDILEEKLFKRITQS